MRRIQLSLVAPLLAAVSLPAIAQGPGDWVAAAIPQYVSIKIGSGATAKTVSQLSIPLVAVVPITSRFSIDVATAYANSDVSVNGSSVSSINGLTDTQVRANFTLGNDAVVLTAGLNLPTGQYTIPDGQAEAAGQIGNDFLIFPTSSYGAGLSGTGGVAFAHPLGGWNLGVAASARHSTEFDAFTIQNKVFTFTPADEYRARVGIDRYVGTGKLTLGATYSEFGKDIADSTSYSTGARIIGQASYYVPVGTTDLFLSGWNLYRAKWQRLGGVSPPANVLNGSVSVGMHLGGLLVEPNLEGRFWQTDGVKAGTLGSGGVRLRWVAGPLTILPSATYQVGSLYSTTDTAASIDVTGWRASVMVRVR